MGNDGDKNGAQGTEPQTTPKEAAPASPEPAVDALAKAAAAAEAAAKAAEEARRKADELARQAAAAKERAAQQAPPPSVSEPPDLKVGDGEVETGAPIAAEHPPAAIAPSEEAGPLSVLTIDPDADGLFGSDLIDEEAGRKFEPEPSYLRDARYLSAMISLVVAIVLIIGGVIFLMADSEANARMKWFLSGTSCTMDPITKEPILPEPPEPPGNLNCLQLHVEQERRSLEDRWRQEDFRSRHIYGTVTLTYFPQDARVDVYQAKYIQDGKAWARNEAGPGDAVCDELYVRTPEDKVMSDALKNKALCERPLKNNTETLEKNQFIERLPLKSLPIFETDKCTNELGSWDAALGFCKDDGKDYRNGTLVNAYSYQYRVVISRDGYEPREFLWTRRDWTRAPGQYIMNWPGADLIPKPETFRANFVKAHCQIFCYQQIHDVSFVNIPPDNLDMIFKRSGFKSEDEFRRAEGALTRGEFRQWWLGREQAIGLVADRVGAINKTIPKAADRLKCNEAKECAKLVCEYQGGSVCDDVAAEGEAEGATPEVPTP